MTKQIKAKFLTAPPEAVQVQLETGNEGQRIQATIPPEFETATVFCYDVERIVWEFLLDEHLFGNIDNLVFHPDDPFGHFVPPSPEDPNFGEVVGGKWFQKTYTARVTSEGKQLLLPIIIYMDKTGTDRLVRYGLEPILITTPILKRSVRRKVKSWRLIR